MGRSGVRPENVVSIQLHMDESTRTSMSLLHPIKDGKLQAKAWLDGGSKLAGSGADATPRSTKRSRVHPQRTGETRNRARPTRRQPQPLPSCLEKMSSRQNPEAGAGERHTAGGKCPAQAALLSRQKGRYSADNDGAG